VRVARRWSVLEMQINIAQLLRESVGASRAWELNGSLTDDDGASLGVVTGNLKLTKTDVGIWASGRVKISVDDFCSRCLKPIEYTVAAKVDDEYLPTFEVDTGRRIRHEDVGDADMGSIDNHHELDLTGTLREYRQAGIPLAPLCKEDCNGICTQCGVDLNENTHDCQPEMDPRWAKLRELMGESS
jgi:uncharacterized protein